jgi:hypothetical protein
LRVPKVGFLKRATTERVLVEVFVKIETLPPAKSASRCLTLIGSGVNGG